MQNRARSSGLLLATWLLGGCLAPLDGDSISETHPSLEQARASATSEAEQPEPDLTGTGAAAAPSHATGFAWAHQTSGSYDTSSSYSYNSSGGTNHVTWLETGLARVDFPGLGDALGGTVQVTAYGSEHRCKVRNWNRSGTTLRVFVRCFGLPDINSVGTGSDLSANARFVVSYLRRSGTTGPQGGYVWSNQPSTASFTPSATYQWNSAGGSITVERGAEGSYAVMFPGQDFIGGTVEVTAYGSGDEHCKVLSWSRVGDDQRVNVRCFSSAGAPVDSRFTARFTRVSPLLTSSYGYAWANQANAASYTPSLTYQQGHLSSECGTEDFKTLSVTRTSVGRYAVQIPHLATSGPFGRSHAQVTAYGFDSSHCNIVGWTNSGSDVVVRVACYDAGGDPIDTRYVVHFASTIHIVC